MVYASNTAPETLHWGSYFWWVDSRSKTLGWGCPCSSFQQMFANSFTKSLSPFTFPPAGHEVTFLCQPLAFLESSPPVSQEYILSARSMGHPGGWAGAAGSSQMVKSPKNGRLTGEGRICLQVGLQWVLVLRLELLQVALLWPCCWRGSYCARIIVWSRWRGVPLKWLLLHLFS